MKMTEVYLVDVSLENDPMALRCVLCNKPDASILATVAELQGMPDIAKVLTLAGPVDTVPDDGRVDTKISVVGVVIGTISVETRSAYVFPVKRPRTPRVIDPNRPKLKRGRPRKVVAETPVA